MRIAILDDYQRVALRMADWSGLPGEITVFDAPFAGEEAAAAALEPFDILCVMRERTPLPGRLIERLPRLRLIVTSGPRNPAIDVAAAAARGITVCGTESPGHATAELTWGLILALARHIPAEEGNLRAGGWQTTLGRDLRGKVLGVIGLGRLGSQVARIGAAFGMEVIAWSANLTAERAIDCGARRVERDDLLRGADVVTLHLQLGERYRGLIGAAELALMKPTAWLVNTSRAPIVDTDALVAALGAGTIGGAALDVHDLEPLPAGHPLRDCPNTVLTPHIGYVTEETYRIFYGQTVEAVRAFLAGAPVRVIG